VKKIIGVLVLSALLPAVLITGCGSKSNPSGPGDSSNNTPTPIVIGPAGTFTATMTNTATNTGTITPATATNTATRTTTNTATNTATNSATNTATNTGTVTPLTATNTTTSTATSTDTSTPTMTATNTATNTTTNTATKTMTNTASYTPTITATAQTAQAAVNLNSAAHYAVLAYSGITSTGSTTICGNIGLSPSTSASGAPVFLCTGGFVTGTNADNAQLDLTTAYNNAAGRLNPASISGDLGGLTLYPGLYNTAGGIGITGDLTLDAQGNTNAIFIFQIGTTLTTASGGNVILANGATAANIFWQVGSSCALGTTSSFVGTIMAHTTIAFNTGATLSGRALSETGQVTMQSNTITNPTP